MNGRESDADFGRTLRHGRGIAAIVVAVVIATAGVIGAAFAMAKSAAADEAARTFASEEHRERLEHVAAGEVERRVAAPMARIEVEVRQLREIVTRIEANTRPVPLPRKARP